MNKNNILDTIDPNGYLWKADASRFYDILQDYPEEGILLEIGTGRGDSATFWSMVKPKWTIYTIDSFHCASDYIGGYGLLDLEKQMISWRQNGQTNIIPIIANSKTVPWYLPVDVIYIDGDHSYQAIKSDFERFTPFLKEGGVVFGDDYWKDDPGLFDVQKYLKTEVEPTGKWKIEPLERMMVVWPIK